VAFALGNPYLVRQDTIKGGGSEGKRLPAENALLFVPFSSDPSIADWGWGVGASAGITRSRPQRIQNLYI